MRGALHTFLLLLVACGSAGERSSAGTATPGDVAPDVLAVLDSANQAYQTGKVELARVQYRDAALRDSTLAAAWFGVFMSERAAGNTAAADSALRRVRVLAEGPRDAGRGTGRARR
jgi:hypothetical protein